MGAESGSMGNVIGAELGSMGNVIGAGFSFISNMNESEMTYQKNLNEANSMELQSQQVGLNRGVDKTQETYNRIQNIRQVDNQRRDNLVTNAASGFTSNSQSISRINDYNFSLAMQNDRIAQLNTQTQDMISNVKQQQLLNESNFTRRMADQQRTNSQWNAFGNLLQSVL